jgi:hypothetical protein
MRWLVAFGRWLWKKALLAFAALGFGGACDAGVRDVTTDTPSPVQPQAVALELVGIGGRRLADTDTYVVPLDGGRHPLAIGEVFREAFVVLNDSPAEAAIAWMTVTVTEPDDAGVWFLTQPTRAADLPLPAGPWTLAPGGRFDFDLRFAPTREEASSATLELAVRSVHGLAVRRIMLTGRVARGPPPP